MSRTENPENVVRIHEAPLLHSGVLQWQRGWTVNPLSNDFVGSSPTSRTQLALWYNGSTTGFGPVSEGSIPSGATRTSLAFFEVLFSLVIKLFIEL